MSLDLNILKVITTNKRHAITFIAECNNQVFSSEFFSFGKHLIDYIKLYKDVPTKRTLLDRFKKGSNQKLIELISKQWDEIEAHQYDEKEYAFDLIKIKERLSQSLLQKLGSELQKANAAEIDVKEIVKQVRNTSSQVSALFEQKKFDQKTLKDIIPDFRDYYATVQKNKDFGKGILTGYKQLDKVLNGLRKQEFLLIGGETGSGKSISLCNFAVQMWMQKNTIDVHSNFSKGYNGVFFSLEMPLQDTFQRKLARMAMVNQRKIRDAKLDTDELARLKKAVTFIENYPYTLEIVDASQGCTLEFIETTLLDIKSRYIPDFIIIDYMALMDAVVTSSDSEDADWLKLEKISEQLFKFCRSNDVALISAAQLKDGKTSGKDTGQHRLARAKGVLKNVNFFIQLVKRDGEEKYTDMPWKMVKSRRTELCDGSFIKDFQCCALLDSLTGSEDDEDDDNNQYSSLI